MSSIPPQQMIAMLLLCNGNEKLHGGEIWSLHFGDFLELVLFPRNPWNSQTVYAYRLKRRIKRQIKENENV